MAGLSVKARRRLTWTLGGLAAALLLYALLGFIVLPWLAKARVEEELSRRSGGTAAIERLRVNPFLFTVSVEEFSLDVNDGDRLLDIERIHVDFELSSLFRWAFLFREVSLTDPSIQVRRHEDGSIDLLVTLERLWESLEIEDDLAELLEDPIRLIVTRLAITGGSLSVRDDALEPPFATRLAPLTFQLQNLSTLLGESGGHAFVSNSEAGERFMWSGNVSLQPPTATGRMATERFRLQKYEPYTDDLIPLAITRGSLSAAIEYRVALEDRGLSIQLHDGEALAEDVAIRFQGEESDFVELASVQAAGLTAVYPALRAEVEAVGVRGGRLKVRVDEDLKTNLDPLLRLVVSDEGTVEWPTWTRGPLRARVGPVDLTDVRIEGSLAQAAGTVEAEVALAELRLTGLGLPITPSSTVAASGRATVNEEGSVDFRATVGLDPPHLTASTNVERLALRPFQALAEPWVDVDLVSGLASARGTLVAETTPKLAARFEGRAGLVDLEARETTGATLVRAMQIEASGVQVAVPDFSATVDEVVARKPFLSVRRASDESVNVAGVFRTDLQGLLEGVVDWLESPPDITVRRLRVEDGAVDYTDRSVAPEFSARVRRAAVTGRDLSTAPGSKGRVQARAIIERTAKVAMNARIQPFTRGRPTSISFELSSLSMPKLSPYAAHFVGFGIDAGKLDVTADYDITGAEFDGENQVFVERFVLGDKVDGEAEMKVPVRLGVALLRDKDGNIDVEVPLSGSLTDPKLRIGALVGQAIVNVLEKTATAPFRALGGIFSAKDDSATVPFIAGTSTTSPAVHRDILRLEQSLFERPALTIELEGRWAPDVDRAALAAAELDAVLADLAERSDAPGSDLEAATPNADRRERLLRDAYRRAFAQAPPTEVETSTRSAPLGPRVLRPWSGPRPSTETPPVWLTVPVAELVARLQASIPISEDDLRQLGSARAAVVQRVLLTRGRVEEDRVFLRSSSASEAPATTLRLSAR